MMCPSWDQGTVIVQNSCGPVEFGANTQNAGPVLCSRTPTQWWFWILAGALGFGLLTGGGR